MANRFEDSNNILIERLKKKMQKKKIIIKTQQSTNNWLKKFGGLGQRKRLRPKY